MEPSALSALGCLPVHVDDRGGDGDHHAQQGWQQAETAAEFNLKIQQQMFEAFLPDFDLPDNFFYLKFWRKAWRVAPYTSSVMEAQN